MPGGYDAVSPMRRPRAFARALGALAAEQAGPRGRTVLLRSTVEGEAFSTAHRSQTVYHGPVVYSDDPYRRLERASSDLELLLLLVFLKDAAHRGQREYRFLVWAEQEPREDRLDLPVSPALVEAMQTPRRDPDGGGFVPAAVEESSTVEAIHEDGFIVITAELPGDELVEASIAVGPDGTYACRISAGDTHLASTAPDAPSFVQVLTSRLAEVGVYGRDGAAD